VQEANDPVARDRGAADLAAALEADARVRALARNPMLATLIALVHRYEAHLPGERAALYNICVKTLLETWPSARRRTFREIDAGLQRAYLEALALRMQRQRSAGDKEVVIERGALVDALVEILRRRGGTLGPDETARGLVERWVRFLEEGTGILVEQRPGVNEIATAEDEKALEAIVVLRFHDKATLKAVRRRGAVGVSVVNHLDALQREFHGREWGLLCGT
jgi:predicted NACHT family NTPase